MNILHEKKYFQCQMAQLKKEKSQMQEDYVPSSHTHEKKNYFNYT